MILYLYCLTRRANEVMGFLFRSRIVEKVNVLKV